MVESSDVSRATEAGSQSGQGGFELGLEKRCFDRSRRNRGAGMVDSGPRGTRGFLLVPAGQGRPVLLILLTVS